MDTSNISIVRAHCNGEKSDDKERAIVVQFLFYKDNINIFRNRKKFRGTRFSMFQRFSQETMQICKQKWKEILANKKQGKILYLQYRSVICKEGRTPA